MAGTPPRTDLSLPLQPECKAETAIKIYRRGIQEWQDQVKAKAANARQLSGH